jgi:hypothetical protein
MTLLSKSEMERPDYIIIDLTGPQGNAFYLLGIAQRLAQQLGLNKEEILKDMKSEDYKHLLGVMEKHFGEFIIMYR